jgi:hypothetical protein
MFFCGISIFRKLRPKGLYNEVAYYCLDTQCKTSELLTTGDDRWLSIVDKRLEQQLGCCTKEIYVYVSGCPKPPKRCIPASSVVRSPRPTSEEYVGFAPTYLNCKTPCNNNHRPHVHAEFNISDAQVAAKAGPVCQISSSRYVLPTAFPL